MDYVPALWCVDVSQFGATKRNYGAVCMLALKSLKSQNIFCFIEQVVDMC